RQCPRKPSTTHAWRPGKTRLLFPKTRRPTFAAFFGPQEKEPPARCEASVALRLRGRTPRNRLRLPCNDPRIAGADHAPLLATHPDRRPLSKSRASPWSLVNSLLQKGQQNGNRWGGI